MVIMGRIINCEDASPCEKMNTSHALTGPKPEARYTATAHKSETQIDDGRTV